MKDKRQLKPAEITQSHDLDNICQGQGYREEVLYSVYLPFFIKYFIFGFTIILNLLIYIYIYIYIYLFIYIYIYIFIYLYICTQQTQLYH